MSIDRNSRAARQMRQQSRRRVKKKRKKRLSTARIIVISAVVLIAVGVGSLIGYFNHLWNLTADLEVNMEEVQVNPNLDIQTEIVQKGFWKIAVFGVDSTDGNLGKGANSDVIIICSVNRETGEIKMASVYRDTYLKVGDKNPYRKINEAYARGGPEQALKALSENLDIAVDDFVAVNWKAVADAINNLGGVDIDITEAEFRQINGYITSVVEYTGVYSQHLKAPGFQHLDGVQAVAYCRLRKMDTDFQRTQRQRAVISQCLEKAKQSDIRVIHALIGVCLPQVAHSFKLDDLLEAGKNINRYYLGDTAGFPFDLKIQDVGKLDCVVPVTLESNVIKLHQFLFGTENYQPSEHVVKISNDIAYNSAKQADSGEDLHQEDIEKMSSEARESGSKDNKRQTEENTKSESTKASEQETDENGNRVRESESSYAPEEGEDPNTQSDEYVPEDQLINDPGLRRPEESSGSRESESGNPGIKETERNNSPGTRETESSTSGTKESESGKGTSSIRPTAPPSSEAQGPSIGTGPGSGGSGGTANGTGSTGPGSNKSSNPTNSSTGPGSGGTVHTTRPIATEPETTGIEGGPGFFNN